MTIRGIVKLCFFEFLFDVQKSSGGILNCFVKCWLLLSPLTTLVSFFLGRKLFRCEGKITEWMPFSTGLRGNWGITETISPYIGALQLSPALGPLWVDRSGNCFFRALKQPADCISLDSGSVCIFHLLMINYNQCTSQETQSHSHILFWEVISDWSSVSPPRFGPAIIGRGKTNKYAKQTTKIPLIVEITRWKDLSLMFCDDLWCFCHEPRNTWFLHLTLAYIAY